MLYIDCFAFLACTNPACLLCSWQLAAQAEHSLTHVMQTATCAYKLEIRPCCRQAYTFPCIDWQHTVRADFPVCLLVHRQGMARHGCVWRQYFQHETGILAQSLDLYYGCLLMSVLSSPKPS